MKILYTSVAGACLIASMAFTGSSAASPMSEISIAASSIIQQQARIRRCGRVEMGERCRLRDGTIVVRADNEDGFVTATTDAQASTRFGGHDLGDDNEEPAGQRRFGGQDLGGDRTARDGQNSLSGYDVDGMLPEEGDYALRTGNAGTQNFGGRDHGEIISDGPQRATRDEPVDSMESEFTDEMESEFTDESNAPDKDKEISGPHLGTADGINRAPTPQ